MTDYTLSKGNHDSPADGRCAMEWTAYIAGEPHSDHPVCVSPVLQTFCISFNDALDDDTRQRLRPYLARCIGTAGDGKDDERAWLCTDWLIRTFAPAWLDLAGLHSQASNLRSLGAVLSAETAKSVRPTLDAVGKDSYAARVAAWDAARVAAWDAARVAAGVAAWDAARVAARDAAGVAAWDAARVAARAAARVAARAAARDAAWDALQPTVKALQGSAFDLLDSMLPKEWVELPAPVKARAEEVCAL